MSLYGDLQGLDCGDVDSSDAARRAYRHDASVFELMPQAVVAPRNVADISKIVRYASSHSGIALTPRSAGTDMSGAAIGEGVVLDFTKHMNTIRGVVREATVRGQDGHAVAQPGMYYRDFEKATLEQGLQYPVYPASRELCALGGMVANNSAGERSLKHGQAVDWVRSVRAVLADGNEYELGPLDKAGLAAKLKLTGFEGDVYRSMTRLVTEHAALIHGARPRVTKNASGYNLWRVLEGDTFNLAKLIVGSQGTLGIVTEATLGLLRPPTQQRMVVVFLRDLQRVTEAVGALLPFSPEALESFDDKTLAFTLKFLPDFVRVMGASNIISLGFRFLPEAWMVLVSGAPQLVLLAEFAGDDADEVRTRAEGALAAARGLGLKARMTSSPEESHKYWTIRRSSFQVIRSHSTGKRTTPFIDDVIVPVAHMPEFLPKLYDILRPYQLTLTVAGHAGNGNFHVIPLMDLSDERSRRIIPEISDKVYSLVLKYGGSITAEHNDGLIRGPWVAKQFGTPMYNLFREVKKIWDPKGIFNPGKKIDVDWDSALAHLRKD
jgi:FAD/FMN-containing dehydrogenase